MQVTAARFQPMLSTVIWSQDTEVTLGKQPIFIEYGREVRKAINAFPPEVSRDLMSAYSEPQPQLVASMTNAIMSRELAIENAGKEQNLDQEWLGGDGKGRPINEKTLGASDEWNAGPGE